MGGSTCWAAPSSALVEVARFETADRLCDCCWSRSSENVLVSASGRIRHVGRERPRWPRRSFEEHTHEVYGALNRVRKDVFLSTSWDDTVKLWSLDQAPPSATKPNAPGSLRTFAACVLRVRGGVVAAATDVFATASGDCTLKIWDVRHPH